MSTRKGVINTTLLFCEKFLVLLLNFSLVIILARNLSQDQFGEYASVIAFSSLFLPLTTLGLNNLVSKYFIKFPKAHYFYFNASLRIRFVGAISALLIGIPCAFFIYNQTLDIVLIVILLFAQAFNIFNLVEYYFLSRQQVSNTLPYRVIIKLLIRFLLIVAAFTQVSNLILISI